MLTLRGRDQTRSEPGAAPPHAPSQTFSGNIAHPELCEVASVEARGPEIGDHQSAAGAQDAHRLLDRLLATSAALYVVNREVGDDQIEDIGLERQLAHIGRVQFDPVGHSFGLGVAVCDLGRIARLILASPQIDPNRPAGRQMLGGEQQYGARPQPRSKIFSSPRNSSWSSNSAQTTNLPRRET